jgi:hypothetical protein
MTTPSAPLKVASRYFIDAQPPLLFQEGTTLSKIAPDAYPRFGRIMVL